MTSYFSDYEDMLLKVLKMQNKNSENKSQLCPRKLIYPEGVKVCVFQYPLQAWKDRAVQLNALPPQGRFTAIPNIITNQAAIINSLNYSFKDFASYMHCLIKRDPRQRNSLTTPYYYRMFGKERVIMGKQLYCSFCLNHLLYLVFLVNGSTTLFFLLNLFLSLKTRN